MSYSIDAPRFNQISYEEGDHSMSIEVDLRDRVPLIYKSVITAWNPPHDGEPLSDAKKEEIIRRVEEWLTIVKKFPSVEIDRS